MVAYYIRVSGNDYHSTVSLVSYCVCTVQWMQNFLADEMYKERARRESVFGDCVVFLPLSSEVQSVRRNLDLISCTVIH